MDNSSEMWAVALSAFGGAFAAFFMGLGLDAWRGRFQLGRKMIGVKEQLVGIRRTNPNYHVEITTTEEAEWWVITLDTTFVNRGYQPDAVLAGTLDSPLLRQSVAGRIRADEVFRGVTIAPHSVELVRFRFIVEKRNLAGGVEDFTHAVNSKGTLRLEWETARGSLASHTMSVGDLGAPMFTPGQKITYLHVKP